MKIFFETLNDPINLHSLMLLADNGDFFYAEPVNNAVIGHGLLFNEHMFYFESNEERTKIKIKDSKNYIADGVKGWLSNFTDIQFIHMGENDLGWELLKDLTKTTVSSYMMAKDIQDYYNNNFNVDEPKDIIEKCYIVKKIYNLINKENAE